MDSVRFGRALGVGARAAAKTLVTAVDAAASPNPSAKPRSGSGSKSAGQATVSAVSQQVVRTAEQARQATEEGRRLGRSVWRPFVKLSGVLWLEFTGFFFGIFAMYAASGAWKLRGELHETATNHDAHTRLLLAAGMALLFGYFCFSSFLRARRKGRAE